MAEPGDGPPQEINSPLEAFELMQSKLRSGDFDGALAIGDQLIRLARNNLLSIRGPLADALAAGVENGRVNQRIWEIERMLGLNAAYFSGAGQDRFVEQKVFPGKAGGVFVDVGAYDGILGSNTLYFEKFRNWSGLCVEASPIQFAKLADVRAAECLNAAVADVDGEARFLEITKGFDQMSVLVNDMRPNFLAELEMMSERNPTEHHEITVPVTTFAAIARERDLTRVDYCSVDVEGAEMKVLQGIDFDYTDIGALSVENPPGQTENSRRIRGFLDERGYRLAGTMGEDDIFVKA
ncbi:MAG: FkbM family methyltransferase [Rhodospirillales bacterium]